ncbi:MAG TPA: hypothetical protein VF812_05195 [Ktedonobacterales bacterium]
MAGTILRLGWTDPRTDVFGAHPLLGATLDLNDGVTFTLLDGSLDLAPPPRELALAGNPRALGERAVRASYRHNRQARARLCLGPMASYSDLVANVRTLVRWLDAAPSTPFCVQWQPPSATSPVYLDVVGAAHGIPADEREWLRLQIEPIEVVLLVRPGLRGDRVTLSNLSTNPGFEAPSGGGIGVFQDQFTTVSAYTTVSGGIGLLSNTLELGAGALVTFGSSAWGAFNQWQVRFNLTASGATAQFYLHYVGAVDWVRLDVAPASWALYHNIAGTLHTLASGSVALTAGMSYWLVATQFPAAPGMAPDVTLALSNDSSGSVGTLNTNLGTNALCASTNTQGVMGLGAQGAQVNIGGFAGKVTNSVALFGPGAWGLQVFTGIVAGAWEQNPANTYSGATVTSYGAARIDAPATGPFNAGWTNYSGGAPAGTAALPVLTPTHTMYASAWVRSSGMAASGSVSLTLREWDVNGVNLRQTTLQSLSGNQASWVKLSGSVITGANTAYVDVILLAADATSASANATVWFDNVQCWNANTTGATSMPYCELRFPQSPAQLLVTGLLGDLPAPAFLAWATYLSSWGPNTVLSYAIGRRAQASANARLVGGSHGFYGSGLSPQSTAILDASAYGGYYPQALVNPSWNPRGFSFPPSDLLGVYHLFSRFQTAQAAGNLGNVETRVVTQQKQNGWYGTIGDADQLGAYNGPWSFPISQSATWTAVDSGQVNVPALPAGALTDLTQNELTPRPQWQDTTAGGSTCKSNWQALIPVDGALLVGVVNNPSNGVVTVTNSWLWVYHDGLLANRAGVGDTASATYSVESTALANPGHAGGGPGTTSSGPINVNSGADPYLTLDPSVSCAAVSGSTTAAGGSGVNQLAAVVADGVGAVLAFAAEIQYSPLYLYPR